MKRTAVAVLLFFAFALPAAAQEYFDIGVDVPTYPEMQPVPDSPVYYAPGVDSNYFFYDGLYWDFANDNWYSSAWYNGPWQFVDPVYVPTYVLWVPVRYYRHPPGYFRAWHRDYPPHWSARWGNDWQARHNQIYRSTGGRPSPAPLPHYQRQYSGASYPRMPQQQSALRTQNYAYQPREQVSRQHYEERAMPSQQAQGRPQGERAQREGSNELRR
jgi:hypothetical protein